MPTSPFPLQLAQQILANKQSRIQAAAQTKESRAARMQADELARSQLSAQQSQAMATLGLQEEQLAAQQAQSKAGMELQAKAQAEELSFRREQEKRRWEEARMASTQKGISDLMQNGGGFIPDSAMGDFLKLKDSFKPGDPNKPEFMETPIPGAGGMFVTRVNDPRQAQAIRDARMKEEKHSAEMAALEAQANEREARVRVSRAKEDELRNNNGVSREDLDRSLVALNQLRSHAESMGSSFAAAGDMARSKAIASDWRAAYDNDPTTKEHISALGAVISAGLTKLKERAELPAKSNRESQKIAGVADTLDNLDSIVTVVGRATQKARKPGDPTSETFLLSDGSRFESPVAPQGSDAEPMNDRALTAVRATLDAVKNGKLKKDDPSVKQAATLYKQLTANRKPNSSNQ